MITKIEHLADYLFALLVKTERGWKCERCDQPYSALPELNLNINIDGYWHSGLELSHFVDRQYQATRYFSWNVDLLCSQPCHRVFEHRKAKGNMYYEWKSERMESLDISIEDLIAMKHEIVQRKRFDYIDLVQKYIKDLKAWKCSTDWIFEKYGRIIEA